MYLQVANSARSLGVDPAPCITVARHLLDDSGLRPVMRCASYPRTRIGGDKKKNPNALSVLMQLHHPVGNPGAFPYERSKPGRPYQEHLVTGVCVVSFTQKVIEKLGSAERIQYVRPDVIARWGRRYIKSLKKEDITKLHVYGEPQNQEVSVI